MSALLHLAPQEPPAPEPGSFRDPAGGVVTQSGRVFRYLTRSAGDDVRALLDAGWYKQLVAEGDVVDGRPLQVAEAPEVYALDPAITLVVEHSRIGFVSYAYEWPFAMLKDAAAHQLELTLKAFANGYIVKDATPFNVQFEGTRAVFIDVPSFERYEPGSGWRAYAQFCRMFLNPLFLQAYGGLAFHPWLRSSIDGIDTDTVRRLLPFRAKLRPSVFIDVVLQSMLNHRFSGNDKALTSASKRKISDDVVRALLNRMVKTIDNIERPKASSAWLDYTTTKTHYTSAADAFKENVVRTTLAAARPNVVWDLGCNTGQFSMIAAESTGLVLAVDSDEASVDALYRRVKTTHTNILPVVMDLLNPSPDQGWAQSERRGFASRGTADWALALALVHHLAISGNVPFGRLVDWFASITRCAIIEFVPKSDPMVQRLLITRKDVYPNYTQAHFESALATRFRIIDRAAVPDSGRILYTVARS